jgi:hypothetical protein
MAHRYRIQIIYFVNALAIFGKHAIFDKSIRFKHWFDSYLFRMILIIYKFFEKKFIMAQVLLEYTANILLNRKGGGIGIAKRSK